jgi:outer membrane biosynthesis protein TonB
VTAPHSSIIYDDALPHQRQGGGLFPIIFVLCTGAFVGMGLYLKTVKSLPVVFDEKKMELIRTRFMVNEKKQAPRKEAAPVEAVKPVSKEKPVDLTKPVVLGQKENDIQKNAVIDNTVRRVYGLRRVYSIGLGAGGSASEAVIGKVGNTLNKEIDTLKATEKDLKGQLASVTTVTAMPVLLVSVKPEYNAEMIKNKVAGTIAAKLLVDIDGSVKDVILLNDLGYGSREAALAAFRKLKFTPAMEGKNPVAVWIPMTFKFVLQE